MNTIHRIALLSLLISGVSVSTLAGVRSGAPATLRVTVMIGEKTTSFAVFASRDGARLELNGERAAHALTTTDVRYLESQADDVRKAPNDESLCSKGKIVVESHRGRGVGCVGSPSPAAKTASKLANALALAARAD